MRCAFLCASFETSMKVFVAIESGYCWDRVPEIADTLLGVFLTEERARKCIENKMSYMDSETQAWMRWEGKKAVGGDGREYWEILECIIDRCTT